MFERRMQKKKSKKKNKFPKNLTKDEIEALIVVFGNLLL